MPGPQVEVRLILYAPSYQLDSRVTHLFTPFMAWMERPSC